ncbi:MAG: GGDEF domain-containing protein, partial [Marinobacter nauticus]|nr:GGDEF domain-containing protein [Marinobacter nauticus]
DMIVVVARPVTGQSRKVDTIARWGGEEFLVLLPETALAEAAATAERIRSAVASQAIDCAGKRVTATISIGVACIQGSESIDRLLQRADEALYQAKTLGRNRVCQATEALHQP